MWPVFRTIRNLLWTRLVIITDKREWRGKKDVGYIDCVFDTIPALPRGWKKSVESSVRKVGVRASIWTQDLLNANWYCSSLCSVRTRNSVILCASSGPDRSSSHLNCLQRRFLAVWFNGKPETNCNQAREIICQFVTTNSFCFFSEGLEKNRHSYSTFCFVYSDINFKTLP
jgi:hypothetical protein